MISATERALSAGIAAAGPGAASATSPCHRLSPQRGGVPNQHRVRGHAIGSTMHQDPHVPNTGRPRRGYNLRPGLLLALEPWVMADTAELTTDGDRWTLRSATGSRTAHSEPTIAITNDGAEILALTTQAHPEVGASLNRLLFPKPWRPRVYRNPSLSMA